MHRLHVVTILMYGWLGCLFFPLTALATPSDWTIKTERDRILVSVQKTDEQYFAVNAKMYVRATPVAFFALLDNADRDCSWLANCKKITILDRSLPNFRFVHTQFSSPWPAKDRDMYTKSEHVFSADKSHLSIHITDISSAYPANDNVITLQNVEAQWSMTHQFDQWYELNYYAKASVGGWIPNWLGEELLISSTHDTFKSLRNLLHNVEP